MIVMNENYLQLQASYLFSDIAKRVTAFQDTNPDRDVIQVYAEREAGGWTVTDFGEAWDALELGCIASGVGPEARKRAGSVCADLVEREGYQLVLRGVSDEGLAQAVMRLAQAILLVANSGDPEE